MSVARAKVTTTLTLAVLSACEPDPSPKPVDSDTGTPVVHPPTGACQGGAPSLQIGTGEAGFVDTPSGSEVTLVHGPQGGYHVLIGLAATGLGDGPVGVHLTGTVGGDVLADVSPNTPFFCDPPSGRWLTWNVRLVYDAQPADLDTRTTDVDATVTQDGTTLTAHASYVVHDQDRP